MLREAIEGLDLAVHGDVIAEARELHDRLDAVICAAEAAYTAAGLAEVEGFANTAAFERHRCAHDPPPIASGRQAGGPGGGVARARRGVA